MGPGLGQAGEAAEQSAAGAPLRTPSPPSPRDQSLAQVAAASGGGGGGGGGEGGAEAEADPTLGQVFASFLKPRMASAAAQLTSAAAAAQAQLLGSGDGGDGGGTAGGSRVAGKLSKALPWEDAGEDGGGGGERWAPAGDASRLSPAEAAAADAELAEALSAHEQLPEEQWVVCETPPGGSPLRNGGAAAAAALAAAETPPGGGGDADDEPESPGRLASALGIPKAAVARNKLSYVASDAETLSSRDEEWSDGAAAGGVGTPAARARPIARACRPARRRHVWIPPA